MKELSIEQKAKAYDEAINAAIVAYKDEDRHLKATLERIFPELKESDDERIRKALIQIFNVENFENYDIKNEEVIAWLEKQGEHANFRNKIQVGDEVTRNEDGVLVNLSQLNRVAKKYEKQAQKPTDKVEQKFKVGDWVVCEAAPRYTAFKIGDVIQISSNETLKIFLMVKDCFKPWTIQDAKDGDVLYLQKDGKEHIIIYKGVLKERFKTFVSAYCAYNGIVDAFCFADVSRYIDIAYGGIVPATKEQRDALFVKMKEAGYEWDADKKELKKFEQNPTWSEEDELMLTSIIQTLKLTNGAAQMKIDWLKSLKDRVQPQPKWKPSDEQIEALESATANCAYSEYQDCLRELIGQLKKLK